MNAPLTPFGIEAATERIRLRLERSAQDIVAIGHDLIAVRDAIGAEQFQGWIGEQFGMSRTTAYRFISVAERFPNPTLGLSASALYELAAPSTPDTVVEEVKERVGKGENVSVADVRLLRSENNRLQSERDSADASRRSLAKQVSDLRGQLDAADEPQIVAIEPDYSAQITAALSYFGALPIPVREAVWNAYATPYSRTAHPVISLSSEGGDHEENVTAFTQEQDSEAAVHAVASTAADLSDAEHQRDQRGERAAAESAQSEAAGTDTAAGGNGSAGNRGGSKAEGEEAGPAGEGGDPFGGLKFDKPDFVARSEKDAAATMSSREWPDCPPGLLRDKNNPLARLA